MKARDPLARALARLSEIEPSPALHARLDTALREAERQERQAAARPRGHRVRNLGRNLVLVVPALASMAVVLHLVVAEPGFDAGRTAEHAFEMPSHGAGSTDLDLWLDTHDTDFASVRMHVPHGISISDLGSGVVPAPSCHDTGCIYEFMHSTADDAPPVQLRVNEPGRYRVHIEHASEGRRVQEVLVVHARRD